MNSKEKGETKYECMHLVGHMASSPPLQELDYCLMTVPTVSSELPLLQSFVRAPRRTTSQLPCELYICSRSSLRWEALPTAMPTVAPSWADCICVCACVQFSGGKAGRTS